jgi:hypothetical protein
MSVYVYFSLLIYQMDRSVPQRMRVCVVSIAGPRQYLLLPRRGTDGSSR